MSFTDEAGAARATTGVLGALTLERPGEGDILPHERTTPKAKSDRLDLLRATKANSSAIWGLSLAGGLSKLLDPPGEPLGDFTDERRRAPPVLAHRRPRGRARRSARPSGPRRWSSPTATTGSRPASPTATRRSPTVPGPRATLFFVVELVDEQLTVQPIHRLLSGLPDGFDLARCPGVDLRRSTPVGRGRPRRLGLVTRRCSLPARAAGRRRHPRHRPPRRGAGAAPRARPRLPARRRPTSLTAVDSGRAQAGVLLRPVGVARDHQGRRGRRPHAPEDHLLRPEAADRHRLPLAAESDSASGRRPRWRRDRSRAARSPGPFWATAASSWSSVSCDVLGPVDGPEHADRRRLDRARATGGTGRTPARDRCATRRGRGCGPPPPRRPSVTRTRPVGVGHDALVEVGAEADRLAVHAAG